MKIAKYLAAAGLFAAALCQSAQAVATPHIYVTGSTAYRTQAIASISTALGLAGPTGDDTAATTGPKNTSFIWEGGHLTINGTSTLVTVVATFTGSASGVQTVTDPDTFLIPFLPDGSTGHAIHAAYDDATASTPHAGYPTANPHFGFTDVFQATTPFTPDNVNSFGDNYIDTTSDGHDFQVGIVCFKWVASKNFPLGTGAGSVSTLSVEPYFIEYLFGTGKAPLSLLTGNTADKTVEIFATGRNFDSGTRLCMMSDALYGPATAVVQYQAVPEITTTGGSVTQHQLYPIENINGISTGSAGNSGQASGGTLRNYMTVTLATSGMLNEAGGTTAAYYLTTLGLSDFSAVSGSGAVELAYKGVNYSSAAVQTGRYSCWGYEHVIDRGDLGPSTGASATAPAVLESAVVTNIKAAGTDVSAVGLHDDANMQVKRFGEGQVIQPKFSF